MAIRRRRTTDGAEPDAWAERLAAGGSGTGDDDGPPREASRLLVVGGGHVGRRLAESLAEAHAVHHLDTDPNVVRDPDSHGTSHAPDLSSPSALAATGVTAGDDAVVATGRDSRSLLVTQQLRTRFGLERLLVVLEDPRNREAFDLPGVEVVCAGATLSAAVGSLVTERSDDGGGHTVTTSDTV
jgi:hypothetical protein